MYYSKVCIFCYYDLIWPSYWENWTPHCLFTLNQDVDVVWLKDPMKFFHDKSSEFSTFDVLFQHDGSYSVRYEPYAANSGFYYVRANKRSQYLFTSLLYHSDLIITWDSHQQVLVQLLAEHSSLFGLNVMVFGRDTEWFPGALFGCLYCCAHLLNLITRARFSVSS